MSLTGWWRSMKRTGGCGGLSTKSQFVALLYGQLEGAVSLREIAAGLESHQSRLYHLGAAPARRSTLAGRQRAAPVRAVCRIVCGDDGARPIGRCAASWPKPPI